LAALNVEVSGGKKWKKTLSDLAKMKMGVKAGVLGGATTTDGKSIAEYAIYNEFGTQYIPPRPFLSDTAKRKGKDWAHYVSGRDVVEANGGRVVLADLSPASRRRTS
jgi:HK97 gp10 family phage protein